MVQQTNKHTNKHTNKQTIAGGSSNNSYYNQYHQITPSSSTMSKTKKRKTKNASKNNSNHQKEVIVIEDDNDNDNLFGGDDASNLLNNHEKAVIVTVKDKSVNGDNDNDVHDDIKEEEDNDLDSDFLSFSKNNQSQEETRTEELMIPKSKNIHNNHHIHRTHYNNNHPQQQLQLQQQQQPRILPPWMDVPHSSTFHYNTPKLILLHEEIVQFVNLMKPQPAEIEIRSEFVKSVKNIILNLFHGLGGVQEQQQQQERNDDDDDDNNNKKKKNKNGGGGDRSSNNKYRDCEVHVFGSQATGLLLPSSDVDLVVMLPHYFDTVKEGNDKKGQRKGVEEKNNDSKNTNKNQKKDHKKGTNTPTTTTPTEKKKMESKTQLTKEEEQQEMAQYDVRKHSSAYYNEVNSSPLVKIANELKRVWREELIYLEVVENTRVPIVKFTHGPMKLHCDICLNQETGVKAAELVTKFMDAMPPLKPLTFVLKYFMAARGLNEPYSGGIGSFMLQMMIVSFLQHRERSDYNHYQQQQDHHHHRHRYHEEYYPAPMNLGSLLLEFFELYAMDINYLTTAISVREDGLYFPKGHHNRRENFFTNPSRAFTLGIENPIDNTMDVGSSSFRMSLIQKAFEVAMRVLLSHVAQPVVPTESILESIIPPNEEMYKRATMCKVLSIESKLRNQGLSFGKSQEERGKGKNSKRSRTSNESEMDVSDSE
jgi:DNA polymerase sigma